MELKTYDIDQSGGNYIYQFLSNGPKGEINKMVIYQPTSVKNLFNLAFGDFNTSTNELDDLVVTDNGDGEKVLATVVSTFQYFFEKVPHAMVYIAGSTKSRTRLYRMAISKYLPFFEQKYNIIGELSHKWQRFVIDTEYLGFLITLKQ